MRQNRAVVAALALLLSASSLPRVAAAQQGPADIAAANALFVAGKFAEAQKVYTQVASQAPDHYLATLRLGYIALLSNRLDEAQAQLSKALDIKPDAADAKALLAEVFYRRDDFQKALPLLRSIGQQAKADKLASFKDLTPYQVQGRTDSTSVKFVMTDPLPLVRVRVNGGQEVNFFLDTGAGEVLLDTEFARQLGIKSFGAERGTFAGGKQAAVEHGAIDSLTLGDWTIKNLPVQMINTRQFSQLFGDRRVDGAIGTVLFYHFLTTMDYPKGQLVLRRKTAQMPKLSEEDRFDRTTVVPFWMAGDHFMVAWGRIDRREPVLLFVDTGVAGAGAKLTESAIHRARIDLLEDQASEGIGAGGKLRSVPFRLKELALGDAREENILGLFEGPFPWEHTFGFTLDGMIGHDFFKPYAATFDFTGMRLLLDRRPQAPSSAATTRH